ncbi:hypothetical protein ACFU1R_29055 [Priestia megaterium]|uniref:hypothetical protein n=1 Tax=Priestia megaterium TaxID=1404 RepID=UPI00366CCF25
MTKENKQKDIQAKYKEKMNQKKEEKKYPKLVLIFAIILIIFVCCSYYFGINFLPQKETNLELKKVE